MWSANQFLRDVYAHEAAMRGSVNNRQVVVLRQTPDMIARRMHGDLQARFKAGWKAATAAIVHAGTLLFKQVNVVKRNLAWIKGLTADERALPIYQEAIIARRQTNMRAVLTTGPRLMQEMRDAMTELSRPVKAIEETRQLKEDRVAFEGLLQRSRRGDDVADKLQTMWNTKLSRYFPQADGDLNNYTSAMPVIGNDQMNDILTATSVPRVRCEPSAFTPRFTELELWLDAGSDDLHVAKTTFDQAAADFADMTKSTVGKRKLVTGQRPKRPRVIDLTVSTGDGRDDDSLEVLQHRATALRSRMSKLSRDRRQKGEKGYQPPPQDGEIANLLRHTNAFVETPDSMKTSMEKEQAALRDELPKANARLKEKRRILQLPPTVYNDLPNTQRGGDKTRHRKGGRRLEPHTADTAMQRVLQDPNHYTNAELQAMLDDIDAEEAYRKTEDGQRARVEQLEEECKEFDEQQRAQNRIDWARFETDRVQRDIDRAIGTGRQFIVHNRHHQVQHSQSEEEDSPLTLRTNRHDLRFLYEMSEIGTGCETNPGNADDSIENTAALRVFVDMDGGALVWNGDDARDHILRTGQFVAIPGDDRHEWSLFWRAHFGLSVVHMPSGLEKLATPATIASIMENTNRDYQTVSNPLDDSEFIEATPELMSFLSKTNGQIIWRGQIPRERLRETHTEVSVPGDETGEWSLFWRSWGGLSIVHLPTAFEREVTPEEAEKWGLAPETGEFYGAIDGQEDTASSDEVDPRDIIPFDDSSNGEDD